MLCWSVPTHNAGLYGTAWGVHCNRCRFLDTSVRKGRMPDETLDVVPDTTVCDRGSFGMLGLFIELPGP